MTGQDLQMLFRIGKDKVVSMPEHIVSAKSARASGSVVRIMQIEVMLSPVLLALSKEAIHNFSIFL
jgi:hypothetical protein